MAEMPNVNPITTAVIHNAIPCSMLNPNTNFMDTSTSTASYSSKESEGTHKKKRKFSDFFTGLMKEVIAKQESLQKKFIETLERCEQDRIAREEAWKKQELARINRERELLAQERSIAAAKDAAVLVFLKNFSGQMGSSVQFPEYPFQVENVIDKQNDASIGKVMDSQENNSNCGNSIQIVSSSSRWPKEEVDALIRIKTHLDTQYQENTPKGSLWEEISAAMKKIGYDRSSKRCKEKWENINKYYKRVKESNKERPEDSKTCPYFDQLDALYKEKTKKVDNDLKPEELLMHMMGGQEEERNWVESNNEDNGSENVDQNRENQRGDNEEEEKGEEEDDDQYQVVAHNNPLEIMS